ncbi:Serine protease eatA precursor (plasmid) [Escherichia coli]|nr:Serine protease eatA precursor [Escherichia coli]
MNKVFSLKYSFLAKGFIAVSELARRVSVKGKLKRVSSIIISPITIAIVSYAPHLLLQQLMQIYRIKHFGILPKIKELL